MSRDDGFAVMDVSTSIHEDQKFKRLARRHPELIAPAFLAYVATVAESWRAGDRVPIGDAWPALLPFDRAVVAALKRFELLERDGRVACETWNVWFLPALERKLRAKERWARANAKRHAALMADDAQDNADAATLPRGSSAATGATVRTDRPSVPTVPSVLEIPPPPAERGRRKERTNPRARGTAPRDTGDNPRANGHAPRQEREREKRGGLPESVHEILRRAAAEGHQ